MQQAPTYLNAIKVTDQLDNFFFQQYQLACLGQFSYYIESHKEAVVIDPIRDVDDYINLARFRQTKIKYVILTHIHADFIGGHLEIQRRTGAEIVLGNKAKTDYPIKGLEDNEEIQIGAITLRALHTPGHTLESTSFVLVSEGKDYAVFTGDTLFLQEVGRPDLAVADGKISKEDLAGLLYESLRSKIQPLADDVIVYPGHGAGSSCGKAIGAGTQCTIGNQKKLNYALSDISKEEFVKRLTDISAPPQYYFYDAKVNQAGPSDVEKVRQKVLKPLEFKDVQELLDDAIIIDSREDLKEGGIEGAINISFSTTFASYVGLLIKPTQKLIVVSSPGKEELTITRLLRIGYENISGYLKGGFEAWKQNGGQVFDAQIVDIKDFTKTEEGKESVYVDVRNVPEFETIGILENSILLPLPVLEQNIDKLPKDKVLHIFCRMGPRAKTAQSILRRHGFQHFKLIQNGGLSEIAKENNLQISPYQQ